MRSVVLTEKPSQARNVRSAVRDRYGVVVSALGHLLELEEPEDVNPAWKTWSFDLLRPESGFYRYKQNRTNGKGKVLDEIEKALKSAERLIIATDCDREGQVIGESLARHFRFGGEIWRVMFTSEDEKSIRDAFANMKPNAEYLPLFSAGYARAQADQIANLSATRAATLALKPKWIKGALGVGRVRTPTLSLLVRRELAIRDFRPQRFFTLWMDAAADDGRALRLRHRPPEDDRILDPALAKAIETAARLYRGRIAVKEERKHARPPRLMDLPLLQKRAAAFGWSAQKTLDIAQSLYEDHKIITYPRAETRYLPEAIVPLMSGLLSDLRRVPIFADLSAFDAVIRKGKQGFFSDAGLDGASHHAIIVNPNMADRLPAILPRLSADERRLFDLVARSVVAALAPDHVYDRTELSVSVSVAGEERVFRAVGRVSVICGWKEVFIDPSDRSDAPEDEDEDEDHVMPAFVHGESVVATDAGVEEAVTTPPPRFNEGTLIEAMATVYKLLPPGSPERARLEAAKGIGTPATRAGVIEGLKKQGLVTVGKKSQLAPTDVAMAVHDIFAQAAPFIIDPVATAELEFQLDEIMAQRCEPRQVIDAISANTQRFLDLMRTRYETGAGLGVHIKRKPSPAMLKAAEALARAKGVKLTSAQKTDYDQLTVFLGPRPERREDGSYPPSDRQLAYAVKLGESLGLELDDATRADRRRLASWIDAAARLKDRSPATEGQAALIRRIVEENALAPPDGYPDRIVFADAKRFLDAHLGDRAAGSADKPPRAPRGKPPARSPSAAPRPRGARPRGSRIVDPVWFGPGEVLGGEGDL